MYNLHYNQVIDIFNGHCCLFCVPLNLYSNLNILQWIKKNGCPWDSWACAIAAKYGRLSILKWLRSEGCPWTATTCIWAAKSGNLDIVKYCIDNGCNIDTRIYTQTHQDIKSEVIAYLKTHKLLQ